MSPKRPQQPVVESNKFLNADEDQIPEFDDDGDDLLCVDGSLHNASDDGYSRTSDLNREWERQHNQFHTICYRDGLTAGCKQLGRFSKQLESLASAQPLKSTQQ